MQVDPNLFEFATERQAELLRAIEAHGSCTAANRALGLANDAVARAFRKVRQRAARQGYAPGHWTAGTAPGFSLGKVTVQRDGDGTIQRTWERQHPDEIRAKEALEEAARVLAAGITPLAPIEAPAASLSDLLAHYTLTDMHVGMRAWHLEGGSDWDVEIAERVILGCMAEAIRQMPNTEKAIFAQLGDFLHYDGLLPVTPTSGHILDADSRYPKVVASAVRILKLCIDMMLAKHQQVHIIMAEGNHDMASSVWLRVLFAELYRNEPRITVDDSPLPYYAYKFGNVFLGFHHSHLKQIKQLPGFMAAQFAQTWGATTKRYCHTGDKHHWKEADELGMHVIQHPTLASRDAYAARGGWFSERAMQAICYHKERGMVSRAIVGPEIVEAQTTKDAATHL